jgi:hypothetical protein
VFACTCKKTKPKPNPKSVIPKQQAAVVTISPINFIFLVLLINFCLKSLKSLYAISFKNRFFPKQLKLKKKKILTLEKPNLN